ncbi:MAG: hypothetical protein ILP24_00270 [Paludibacteraceae bacterium]|nr:hypothetical protein [Paludibacteraceae bacterium]
MKFLSWAFIALTMFSFTACDDDDEKEKVDNDLKGNVALIANYGMFNGGNGEFTAYNISKDIVFDNVYQSINGVEFNSKIQHMALYNNNLYIVSNSGDKIDIINAQSLKQEMNPITDVENPRFIVVDGNTAYVSCYGATPDFSTMADSYIAKIDLNSNTVVKKIEVPGGPEGLAIANGKLYAAINYANYVAVVNLLTDEVSYIEMPAVTSYFAADDADNLYVTMVSTYSNPTTEDGIAYINTQDNSVETYTFNGISSTYASTIAFNADKTALFVATATYDKNWNLSGSVQKFDIANKTFSTFADNISGINGVSVNPFNDDVYVLKSPDATTAGEVDIYGSDKQKKKTITAGLSPYWVIFETIK